MYISTERVFLNDHLSTAKKERADTEKKHGFTGTRV